MSVQRTIYCDNAKCAERHLSEATFSDTPAHASTAEPPPYLPAGFLRVEWWDGSHDQPHEYQFCGWDCVMQHAAAYPPEEIIPFAPEEAA